MATLVEQELNHKEIPYRVFRHPGPIESLEQAARERGQQPEQVVRSILFRLSGGEYIMALMAGPQQISWRAMRSYLGESRITMATPEEVFEVTGYRPGTVSPFGLPEPVRILVDVSVLAPSEISIGSGERGLAVILNSNDFRLALESYELVELAEPMEGSKQE